MNMIHTDHIPLGLNFQSDAEKDELWREYGAYYICDELFIEASHSDLFNGPTNKFAYFKKIKILTEKGTEYGTVYVPKLSDNIELFDVTLRNAAGEPVAIDMDQLEREYRKKEIIVVPKVTPGCEISIRVEFIATIPLPAYEYYFSGSIPSAITTFTFSEYSPLHYEFKLYNIDSAPTVRTVQTEHGDRKYNYHTYQLKNVLPRKSMGLQGDIASTEPRVALVLRKAFQTPVITTWEKMAEHYSQIYFRSCYAVDDEQIKSVVQRVNSTTRSKFDAADSLLRFVQAFHLCDENEECACNLNTIIDARKGTLWGITALLRKMYRYLDLEVDIGVTRAKSRGGFDELFVTSSSCAVPLLIVTINDTGYVAFPFLRGGKLGEYPLALTGSHALSFSRKEPVMLPPSTAGYRRSTTRFTITVKDTSPRLNADFILYGSLAYETRSMLDALDSSERNEIFQRWLTQLGTSNALETCDISGSGTPGLPIQASITFSNDDQFIKRKDAIYITMSNLFERYFESYDTFRVEDVVVSHPIDDTVEVKVVAGKAKTTADFKCIPCENSLFSATCKKKQINDTLLLQRIVHIDSATIGCEEMKSIYAEILALNRIRESNVTVLRRKSRR